MLLHIQVFFQATIFSHDKISLMPKFILNFNLFIKKIIEYIPLFSHVFFSNRRYGLYVAVMLK